MSEDLLEPQVRRLFANLHHAGAAPTSRGGGRSNSTDGQVVEGEAGREQHGTRVRFVLTLRGSRLIEARYYAYGCPHTLAVCEWLAQRLEVAGMQMLGSPRDWCRTLGIPIVKLGRLLIVEDALRMALERAGEQRDAGNAKTL